MTSWFDDEMDRNDRLWARMSPAEREAATNRAATKRAGVEPGDQDTLNKPMFEVHPDGHVTIVNVRETAHIRSELDQAIRADERAKVLAEITEFIDHGPDGDLSLQLLAELVHRLGR